MDNALRLQYLEAMGIDVWLPVAERLFADKGAAGLSDSVPKAEQSAESIVAPSVIQSGETEESVPAMSDVVLQEGSDDVLLASRHSKPHSEGKAAKPTRPADAESHEIPVPPPNPVGDMDWDELEQTVVHCRHCGLCETRTHAVFGSGNKHAELMLIGEAPGQQEDLQGLPFVGKAGQLLTEMIRAIGMTREEVYITNVVKCRPPNNRDPKPEEMAVCGVYLQRQIELVRPKMILAVGRISAQYLLQTDAPISKLRGKVHFLGEIPLIVIYHPAYLLRSLLEKRKAWGDLQMALRVFRERR